MPVKLTERQKKARGTHQQSRALVPRTIEHVREEIADMQTILADMRYTLGLALDEIRERGLMVKTRVLNSNGQAVRVQKVNPALKVQREAMSAIRSLKRQLAGLREEEELAAAKVSDEEFSEFTT